MNNIIIVGGGGHAKVLIDLIRMSGEYVIKGIIDNQLRAGSSVAAVPVLGGDELLPDLYAEGVKNACIAVGSVRDNSRRNALFDRVKREGYSVPVLIHPSAVVSSAETALSDGVQIMAGAIVQTGTVIGENTLINTGAVVEHDCIIGRNVHLCPGVVVCGGTTLNDNAFIGAGATVIQYLTIGRDSVIGAGAVVLRDVADNVIFKGAAVK